MLTCCDVGRERLLRIVLASGDAVCSDCRDGMFRESPVRAQAVLIRDMWVGIAWLRHAREGSMGREWDFLAHQSLIVSSE